MRLVTKYRPQAKALGLTHMEPVDTLDEACIMLASALNWPKFVVSDMQQVDPETAAYYLYQTVQDKNAQGFAGTAPRVLQKNVEEGEGWPEPSPAPSEEPEDLDEPDEMDEMDEEDDNPLG